MTATLTPEITASGEAQTANLTDTLTQALGALSIEGPTMDIISTLSVAEDAGLETTLTRQRLAADAIDYHELALLDERLSRAQYGLPAAATVLVASLAPKIVGEGVRPVLYNNLKLINSELAPGQKDEMGEVNHYYVVPRGMRGLLKALDDKLEQAVAEQEAAKTA